MQKSLLSSLILIAAALDSHAFDFKGVRVGAKATVAEVQERLGISCGVGHADMQVCNGQSTVADEPGTINVVISPSGVVERIRLDLSPEPFEQVAAALTQKFGTPSRVDRGVVQNRFGAKFQQVEYVWLGKNGIRIDFSKYAGTLDRSQLYFSTREDRALLSDDKPKKRAKDL